jgi:segregation and condensation protein A
MAALTVSLPSWNGPLDLLLDLIRESQVNIHDIPIREITRQYLETIELMQKLDVEMASEFLVMAATLVHIKSRMILPAELQDGEDDLWEDPRRDLVRQLLEYQKFKELAQELDRREAVANRLLERREQPMNFISPRGEDVDLWKDVTLHDLIKVFTEVVRVLDFESFGVLREEEFRVEDKMEYIRAVLAEKGEIDFFELFGQRRGRGEIVVTFWAVLELFKVGAIRIAQKDLFTTIMIFPRNLAAGLPGSETIVEEAEAAEADLSDITAPREDETPDPDESSDATPDD